jgi:hypothetical protein
LIQLIVQGAGERYTKGREGDVGLSASELGETLNGHRMDSQAEEYVLRLKARALEERAWAQQLRDPEAAGACLRLADQYEAVAGAYDRLGGRERG